MQIPMSIIMKLLKTITKGKIFKASREKRYITDRRELLEKHH
jgi:hypothetical protein